MRPSFRVLEGLPPYGPAAVSFPAEWGRQGHEGLVVEFTTDAGGSWTGNFAASATGLRLARLHPNGSNILIFASGDLWTVDPFARSARLLLSSVERLWEIPDADDIVLSMQGLSFARLARDGIAWRTRRLSWEGFDRVGVAGSVLRGLAWSAVDDRWSPFEVDLNSGRSIGDAFSNADTEGWEHLRDGGLTSR